MRFSQTREAIELMARIPMLDDADETYVCIGAYSYIKGIYHVSPFPALLYSLALLLRQSNNPLTTVALPSPPTPQQRLPL